MTKLMKQQLFYDILTGLLVAATFALVVPVQAFADLNNAVSEAQTSVLAPVVQTVSYISYGLGTVMVISGIASVKKHTDAPANNPLTGGLGKLGAGAAFLAAPAVVSMLSSTTNNTLGSTTVGTTSIPGFGS